MVPEIVMYFWLTAAICFAVVSSVAVAGVFYSKLNNLTMRVIGFLMAIPVVLLCVKAAREDQRLRAVGYTAVQSSRR
jgi:ABC-type dipeptide/oligopeptide/nickel transport system permease subunit